MMNLYEPGILKHALQLFIRSMSSSMGEQLDNLVEDLYTSQRPTERARFLPQTFGVVQQALQCFQCNKLDNLFIASLARNGTCILVHSIINASIPVM
jgi:hypothetical protein